ncbi:MAG: GIY-YIG nuclease family protein [Chitinophagales bacterium]|jgi:putative endonuclease|nr:GIY-YIG nuclease family protein [Chitinophagales bacterium]
MYTVYILYSEKYSKTYVGFTTDIQARFLSHNELGIKGWTIKFRPWIIIHTEEFSNKAEAMRREKWLKSGIGRDYINNELLKK